MLSTVGVDNGGGHAAWSVGGSTHTRPDGTTLCLACIDVSECGVYAAVAGRDDGGIKSRAHRYIVCSVLSVFVVHSVGY